MSITSDLYAKLRRSALRGHGIALNKIEVDSLLTGIESLHVAPSKAQATIAPMLDIGATLQKVHLVWGTPGSIERTSDGGSEYASGFRLNGRGVAEIIKVIGVKHFEFGYMDFCDCKYKRYGDGIHIDGEPSDTICLASPIRLVPPTAGSTE